VNQDAVKDVITKANRLLELLDIAAREGVFDQSGTYRTERFHPGVLDEEAMIELRDAIRRVTPKRNRPEVGHLSQVVIDWRMIKP
jgi:hypothetical protein